MAFSLATCPAWTQFEISEKLQNEILDFFFNSMDFTQSLSYPQDMLNCWIIVGLENLQTYFMLIVCWFYNSTHTELCKLIKAQNK